MSFDRTDIHQSRPRATKDDTVEALAISQEPVRDLSAFVERDIETRKTVSAEVP